MLVYNGFFDMRTSLVKVLGSFKFRSLKSLALVFVIALTLFTNVHCVAPVCPSDMVYVDKDSQNVSICVDKYEYTRSMRGQKISALKPAGNINYYQCKSFALVKAKGY